MIAIIHLMLQIASAGLSTEQVRLYKLDLQLVKKLDFISPLNVINSYRECIYHVDNMYLTLHQGGVVWNLFTIKRELPAE